MKFTCESNQFLKSINIVEKAIPLKSTLPVMENMFLELKNQELVLRGHNLEMGIEYKMPIENQGENGALLVKSKTLSSIVAKLLNQKLNIEIQNQKMNIKIDKIGFDILGISAEEYPAFPAIQQGIEINLSVKDLKDLIKYTLFSVSLDETKKFLQGVLVKKENNNIIFVSTDGFRLSIKRHPIPDIEKEFQVIIPYKTLNELNKILPQMNDDQKITMIISENQVAFKLMQFVMVSRVIQGQFPDYNHVLPKTTQNQLSISRRAFIDAVDRSGIIATESNNVIRVTFREETIAIKAIAPTLGEFKEELVIKRNTPMTTEESRMAFNFKLLSDVLKIMEVDDVIIEFNDGLVPCLIKPENGDDFIYIIMPIRTSDYHDVDDET